MGIEKLKLNKEAKPKVKKEAKPKVKAEKPQKGVKEKGGKKKLSMMAVLLMIALIPMIVSCIVLNLIATSATDKLIMEEIEAKLHISTMAASKHFSELAQAGDGSWIMNGQTLTLGNKNTINPSDDYFFSLLDEDIYLTLFWGDTRYGTSIRNERGELVTGTQASDTVIKEVLQGGNNKFLPHVEIVGQDFSGYYVPLKNQDNEIIGMMFSGIPYADTEKAIMKQAMNLVLLAVVCAVGFAIVASFVALLVNKRIKAVAEDISVVAGGDFSTPVVDRNAIQELSGISVNLEDMRKRLNEAIRNVIEKAKAVDEGAGLAEQKITDSQNMTRDISNAVTDIAQGATAMAQDVQNANDLTMNIGASIEQVLISAAANIEITEKVYEDSNGVQDQVERLQIEDKETDRIAGEVQNSVNETARVVEEISNAAEAIISIASETNLLALNASIEAARAGEAGRGFAVVADNIKSLAEESDKSAKEITDMLSRISALSDQNKKLTQSIKEATTNESIAFDRMSSSFETMKKQLQESEEGSRNIEELVQSVNNDKVAITDAIESLSSISEENAASTEETSASLQTLTDNMGLVVDQARELRQIADELQQAIVFFRI